MKYRWFNRGIFIPEVEKAAESFLKQSGFRISQFEDGEFKRIVGSLHNSQGHKKAVITIEGLPDDFTVEFAAGAAADAMSKLAMMTVFFGGGALGLKSFKTREYYEKLEDNFWKHMEEKLAGKDGA